MQIFTNSPSSALLMLFCIISPLINGFVGWCFGTVGKAQKDYILQKVEHSLFYITTGGMCLASLALIGRDGVSFSLSGTVGLGLSFTLDNLRIILCVLTAFCWFASAIFTAADLRKTIHKTRYRLFMLMAEGAVFGVFLAGDLFTLLVCFEIMGICAWVLVCHKETADTMRAANSYLVYAVVGGLVSLLGIFMLYNALGTLDIAELSVASEFYSDKTYLYVAGTCAMFAFASKAAMFPLHTWLCQSYTEAPTVATVLLSTILSKTGIFGLFIFTSTVFRFDVKVGTVVLFLGVLTMLVGALRALLSNDLKSTLAFSSMSQIGFILVGVGMFAILGKDGAIAVWGLVLHVLNHSLFKLCLFLSTSTVYSNTGRTDLNLNKIRGFGRGKWLLTYAFGMASFGITGIPLWSGYISKTLLHEAIVEGVTHFGHTSHSYAMFLQGVEWLFLFTGGLTLAYITKLFVCVFVEKNSDKQLQEKYDEKSRRYINKYSCAVFAVIGSISPVFGVLAHEIMEKLANAGLQFAQISAPHHTVHYFAWHALSGACVSIAVGAVVYFGFVRVVLLKKGEYQDIFPKALDLENAVYRPLLFKILPFFITVFARVVSRSFEWLRLGICKVLFGGVGDGKVVPKEDVLFTVYEQQPRGVRGFTGTLSFSLLLFGLGLIGFLMYLILRVAR